MTLELDFLHFLEFHFFVVYFGQDKKRTIYFEAKYNVFFLFKKKKLNWKTTIFFNFEEKNYFNYLLDIFFVKNHFQSDFCNFFSFMLNIGVIFEPIFKEKINTKIFEEMKNGKLTV